MSENQHLVDRLRGIQSQLIAGYQAGTGLSAATKGNEREIVIEQFLSQVFPTQFRFGTGDVTDVDGRRSGQLDVVIELPFAPSLPAVGGRPRLYLAESVAAVVEVKSDVAGQWHEAASTAKALRPISRRYGATMSMGPMFHHIPLFVVAYKGWTQIQTVAKHLNATPEIDGVLIIDPGLFVSSNNFRNEMFDGPQSLWALIGCLHMATSSLKAASTDPFEYIK